MSRRFHSLVLLCLLSLTCSTSLARAVSCTNQLSRAKSLCGFDPSVGSSFPANTVCSLNCALPFLNYTTCLINYNSLRTSYVYLNDTSSVLTRVFAFANQCADVIAGGGCATALRGSVSSCGFDVTNASLNSFPTSMCQALGNQCASDVQSFATCYATQSGVPSRNIVAASTCPSCLGNTPKIYAFVNQCTGTGTSTGPGGVTAVGKHSAAPMSIWTSSSLSTTLLSLLGTAIALL